ncbi:MAG: phosphate/phosphite/phosphonate ABC transporter substrate-binding protein [Candidatus Riflebacteria bacterium]|nr:phosphate/phosphite/phosphonate ABC transporter substrate-binding protein [Candidatus Riflebacteria bacterium]
MPWKNTFFKGNYSVFVFFLAVFLFSQSLYSQVKTEKIASAPADIKQLTLGMIAYSNPKTQYESLLPVADYLASYSGAIITVKLYDSYYSILNDIDHDALDLALLSPVVYSLCMEDPDLLYLGTTLVNGKDNYNSVFITKKDSNIKSTNDLVDKNVGFVDRFSASGYLYPASYLKASNLVKDGKSLYKPVFLGSHEKAVRALLTGQVDAIGTYERIFEYSKDGFGTGKQVSINDFNVLKSFSEKIPEDAFVCRVALEKEITDSLKKALMEYSGKFSEPDSKLKNAWYSGFNTDNQKAYSELGVFLKSLIEAK